MHTEGTSGGAVQEEIKGGADGKGGDEGCGGGGRRGDGANKGQGEGSAEDNALLLVDLSRSARVTVHSVRVHV